MGKWVGTILNHSNRLAAGVIRYRWVLPAGAGANDAAGWHLKNGDRFFIGDLNGNSLSEILVTSPNGQWVGVLEEVNDGYVAGSVQHDWITYPGGGGGWNLGQGDKFYLADINGDDRDEVIIVSSNGEWIGILNYRNNSLQTQWLGHDWIRFRNRPGGWNLGQGDRIFPADIDGDGRKELIIVSGNGQWIGIIEERIGTLVAGYIKHDWVNHPGSSGNTGWNLKNGDKFLVADIDGDGRDEIIVISPNGQWIGILHEHNNTLRAGWIGHDWVNHPGSSGNTGWNLKNGDKFLVADIDGDGRDEIIVLNSNNHWIGILHGHNNSIRAGWIGSDWINHPGGSGNTGWNLRSSDTFYVSDVDDDGRDEIIAISGNGQWIGIIQHSNNALKAGWIGHNWINHPGGSGNTGWNLRNGDTIIPSRNRLLITSPWGNRPIVRIHIKIVTAPTGTNIATMVSNMALVFASRGIGIEIVSTENLTGVPNNVNVGQCTRGNTTRAQRRLFNNRNFVGNNEIVIYFVNSTIPPTNGCAAHPDNRPGAIVARIATQWTLAHEVGHVLDLNHINNNNRLMTGNGTANITNPPPNITVNEGRTMINSNLTINL